jgi:hypothetical protein
VVSALMPAMVGPSAPKLVLCALETQSCALSIVIWIWDWGLRAHQRGGDAAQNGMRIWRGRTGRSEASK